MSTNPALMITYIAVIVSSLGSILLATMRAGNRYRLAATAFSIPLSLYCAGYPGALLIPLIFPLLVWHGITLIHGGQRARGLLYCGPYITLVLLLMFFSFIFESAFG